MVQAVLVCCVALVGWVLAGCDPSTQTEVRARVPALAPGETPSYRVHVAPLVAEACVPCHNPSAALGGYNMASYEGVMGSGTSGVHVVPGDRNSTLLRLIRREPVPGIGPMPPAGPLPPDAIAIIERWVEAGAAP
ncbi:MAG: hypothetical protein MUD01_11360 [Chloroflexaceae bacterium]|nr:hypothetical protein [Chloroflexaceae bacterium]